jgi:hypothetical protein
MILHTYQNKSPSIRGKFPNRDGFKDVTKHLILHETIRQHKLDFCVVIETWRESFSTPFLRKKSAGLDYVWYCLPPLGRSEGILVGFNSQTFRVKSLLLEISFHLYSNCDSFQWSLVVVSVASFQLAEVVHVMMINCFPC